MVLAAVTVSDNKSPLPFFPLTVEYKEKTYAAGKIPGGFIKREGRPHDHEILACRIIDRSIRPLFPEGFKNEVQVFVYVISADQENDADVLGAARHVLCARMPPRSRSWVRSAGVRVGRVQDKWVLNPTFQQLAYSDLELDRRRLAGFHRDGRRRCQLEVSEADVLESLKLSHDGIQVSSSAMQNELLAKVKQPKMEWKKSEPAELVIEAVTKEGRDGQHQDGAQPGTSRRASRRSKWPNARRPNSWSLEIPGQRRRTSARCSATSSTTRCARRCSPRTPRRRTQAQRSARHQHRHHGAAAGPRVGALHARPDAGARGLPR
jgi:polyribonucleotide nucleotidyltransferase